jgi:hypothetical protein
VTGRCSMQWKKGCPVHDVSGQPGAKAWVKMLQGKPAIYVASNAKHVVVSVSGEPRTLTREEWDRLPMFDGDRSTMSTK